MRDSYRSQLLNHLIACGDSATVTALNENKPPVANFFRCIIDSSPPGFEWERTPSKARPLLQCGVLLGSKTKRPALTKHGPINQGQDGTKRLRIHLTEHAVVLERVCERTQRLNETL